MKAARDVLLLETALFRQAQLVTLESLLSSAVVLGPASQQCAHLTWEPGTGQNIARGPPTQMSADPTGEAVGDQSRPSGDNLSSSRSCRFGLRVSYGCNMLLGSSRCGMGASASCGAFSASRTSEISGTMMILICSKLETLRSVAVCFKNRHRASVPLGKRLGLWQ